MTTQKIKSWRGLWNRSGGSLLSHHSSNNSQAMGAASASLDQGSLITAADGSHVHADDAKLIPLLHVDRVQTGAPPVTARFAKCLANAVAADQLTATLEAGGGALAILYEVHDEANRVVRLDSLDLVVADKKDFDLLSGALHTLSALAALEVRQAVADLQVLRYHWTLLSPETHKPYESPLNAAEWLVLADHLGLALPKAKLQSVFAHQLGKQKAYREATNGLVEWPKIAYLIQKVYRLQGSAVDDPIAEIWKDLLENDPVPIITLDDSASYDSFELNVQEAEESISPVAMLGFLKDEQSEQDWKLEQVTDLIHALNSQTMATDESYELLQDKSPRRSASPSSHDDGNLSFGDRLCYERFRHYLMSGSNDLLQSSPPQDMGQPLSHYYICTSHDTYLTSLPDSWETSQVGLTAAATEGRRKTESVGMGIPNQMDAQNYLQALIRGVRCLEMTVWDSNNGKYPVLDRTGAALGPPLTSVWEAIRYFLLSHDSQSFPILVRLENHCTMAVQKVLASQIQKTLGDLVYRPRQPLDSTRFVLPSPKEARGKVIIMAKRPRSLTEIPATAKSATNVHRVMHDDYDMENEVWDYVRTPEEVKSFDELSQTRDGLVVSFDTEGPIYATNPNAMTQSASALVEQADLNLSQAQRQASDAKMGALHYEHLLVQAKQRVENTAMKAGYTYQQIVKEADRSSTGGSRSLEEEKSPKDEGVEIHEVLLSANGQEELARAKRGLVEAADRVQDKQSLVRDSMQQWKQSKQKSEKILSHEDAVFSEAKKARSMATVHREHAKVATERYDTVKGFVHQNNTTANSAETVVVTASTEAKISEKRASEAEARASRAAATASKDKARSEKETNKEEELEQEVNEAAERCARAGDALQAARTGIDRASTQRRRLGDQIKLIEQSTQYKLERSEASGRSLSPTNRAARHGGSFVEKHSAKIREMDQYKAKIVKLSENQKQLEAEQRRLQKDFDEYNHLWKIQSDIASKVRKVADRAAHIADELAEHAEEEREAANLRRTAHQRAEANVSKKGSQKDSLDTQLQQAKRAMEEANSLATTSRERADKLDAETAKLTQGKKLRRDLEKKKRTLNDAKAALDRTITEKRQWEEAVRHEGRRLQLSDEVARAYEEDEASRGTKIHVEGLYHEKATKLYRDSLILKSEAEEAARMAQQAQATVDTKAQIARRAREHKITMDRVTEIPHALASATLLHTTKHAHWEKSIRLPSANVHCIAHHVLQRMVETQPDTQVKHIHDFTQNHLCRIFPSWNDLQTRLGSNYDPVFPWKLGCQLVSMNYHSADENLLVSEGFFRQNGSCGYVLKSPLLLGSRGVEETERWKISILAGYNLPLPKKSSGRLNALRPVIKISVHMGDVASAPYAYETDQSRSSGPNPLFVKETCDIVVPEPSIAMIAFTVWDKQEGGCREFIAGASVPVSRLRQGYRSIALFDSHHSRMGPHFYASLLVHVEEEH